MKQEFTPGSYKPFHIYLPVILVTLCIAGRQDSAFAQSPKFTSTPIENGVVGEEYEYHITTIGWSFINREIVLTEGKLPKGLKLKDFGDGQAVIKGKPKEGGDFPIELTVRFRYGGRDDDDHDDHDKHDKNDDDDDDDRLFANSDKQKFTLSISKSEAKITLSGMTATYTGNPYEPVVTTDPKDLDVKITYNGRSTPPVDAGSYEVEASVDDEKYKGSAEGTLKIGKAVANIDFNDLAAVHDGTPQAVSVTTSPENLKVKTTYNGSETPPTAVGNYDVKVVITEKNYKGSASARFVINAAPTDNPDDDPIDDPGEDPGNDPGPIGDPAGRPVISNVEKDPILYTQGDPGIPVSETAIINDFDDTHMYEATISITENYMKGEDVLLYNGMNGKISAEFDEEKGSLTLSGKDTRSNYEIAISNVLYSNTVMGESNLLSKNLSIAVMDSLHYSDLVFRAVNIKEFHELNIVNAFTPNGDNVNDYWNFVDLDSYAAVEIAVFNKDGKKVFDCFEYDCAWDGKFLGKPLPPDVYFYAIDVNNGKRKYRGTVTILK